MALEYISLKMEPEPATESPPVAPPAATYPQKKQKLQQGLPQDKAPPPQPPLQPPLQQQPQQQPQQQTTPAIEGMPVPPASTATPPVTATSPLPLPTIPPPAPMPDAIESSSGELSNNVTQLGNKLGLGMPMYRFVEIPGYPNFYRCWIEFEPFPERYGEVDGVLGKTEAKMQVAEKTAEQLQEQLRGRQSMMEDILAAAIAPP